MGDCRFTAGSKWVYKVGEANSQLGHCTTAYMSYLWWSLSILPGDDQILTVIADGTHTAEACTALEREQGRD